MKSPAPAPAVEQRQESKPVRRPLVSEAVALGAASLAAYAIVFSHHAGYADYFGYPRSLISLDVSSFVLSGTHLLPLALFALLVMYGLRFTLFLGLIFLGYPLVLIVYGFAVQEGWARWLTVGVGVASLAMLVLVAYAPHPQPRAEPEGDGPNEFVAGSALYRIAHGAGVDHRTLGASILFIGVMLMAVDFARSDGKRDATLQEEFLVSEGANPLVVLRSYSDFFITVPLNRTDHTIDRSFRIVPVVGDTSIAWNLEQLGRLTVAQHWRPAP